MNLETIQDWAMTPSGIAVWLTALSGIIFGTLLWTTDRRMKLGREAALIALLAAVASASRVLFAAIPNVQPVTLFILMIGIHLGARRATAVAVLVALMSNMALGHGPWTFYQALAWSAVGTSGAIFRRFLVNWDGTEVRLIPLAILAFIWGFLYDWTVSLSALAMYQTKEAFLAFLIVGLPFDVLHAVGNVFFAIWLAPSLHRLLWLHLRHDAGRWLPDLPEETQRREAFIAGAKASGNEGHRLGDDPMSAIQRLD
jgi:energy-coupling factor transport system substrate-specific component